jgi:hypothetical protein
LLFHSKLSYSLSKSNLVSHLACPLWTGTANHLSRLDGSSARRVPGQTHFVVQQEGLAAAA